MRVLLLGTVMGAFLAGKPRPKDTAVVVFVCLRFREALRPAADQAIRVKDGAEVLFHPVESAGLTGSLVTFASHHYPLEAHDTLLPEWSRCTWGRWNDSVLSRSCPSSE